MSKLYMVATPIGNLEDITLRALKILESVDVVACEDTRHTNLLLNKYNLKKRTISCHSHNEDASSKGIISLLSQGMSVAYCSDAGTPGISDPGARLVEAVRREGFEVVPIPGPSAVITLLSCAGNVGKSFTFVGFLPIKKGKREKLLLTLIERGESFVFYESPFRVLKTLKELETLSPTLKITIGRELTKAFEEIVSLPIKDAIALLETKTKIKGEFAIVVTPMELKDDNDQED